jgi:hypothetical protein
MSKILIKTQQKNNRRRYRLHQHIKKIYRYNSQNKTVYIPFNHYLNNRFVQELKDKFNYQIQLEIT